MGAYKNISTEMFRKKIASAPGAIILDVRTPEEVAEGSISGSINIDYYHSSFLEILNKLEKNRPYFVYCRSGKRSASTCDTMSKLGFKELYNLEKGFLSWS